MGVGVGHSCLQLSVRLHSVLCNLQLATTIDGAHSREFYNISTGDSASSVLYSQTSAAEHARGFFYNYRDGKGEGFVCVLLYISLLNVSSSHKGYDLLNGQ